MAGEVKCPSCGADLSDLGPWARDCRKPSPPPAPPKEAEGAAPKEMPTLADRLKSPTIRDEVAKARARLDAESVARDCPHCEGAGYTLAGLDCYRCGGTGRAGRKP